MTTIRCHPCAPVEVDDLQEWMDGALGRIREALPHGTVRLLRLTQELPSGGHSFGWLIELDPDDDVDVLRLKAVRAALRDMRLLGLQPTVLADERAPSLAS